MQWADPYPRVAHHRSARLGPAVQRRRDGRLQNDDLSLPARALVPLLRDLALASGPPRARATSADGVGLRADKDSVAAGIYAMWQRRVLANTRERLVPAALRDTAAAI